MFWNEYHRLVVIRNAARSPRSMPSSVRPPKMYMTSLTRAAACPSLGVGMNPMQSNCVQRLVRGSYDQTSLNH